MANLSGRHSEAAKKDAEIAKLNEAYGARIATAQAAKEAAEAKATQTEHEAATALSAADTKHQTEVSNEKAKTAAATAAYLAGDRKLRIYLAANSGSGSAVSGSPATLGSGDGGTYIDVPAAVSGRILAIGAEVDSELVPQISLLQDTVRTYLKACGPQ